MNSNIQIYSPDKFGFYRVGEYQTYSRIEAIEYATKNKKDIHWNYNDEVFSKVDFSRDIDISLDELYKLRCRQIRNSYDYIVLFYSGGSDSHGAAPRCGGQAERTPRQQLAGGIVALRGAGAR